ncbi:hypothetical protein RND81_14G201300 [Saponaria officinalis]
MNAPVNIRQHEALSTAINPCKLISNLGFDEFGIPDSGKNSIVYSPTPRGTPDGTPLEQTTLRQRKFLIFDQSRNETRVMFSSLSPAVQNMPARQTACPLSNPQVACPKLFDAYQCPPEGKARKDEQMCAKTPEPSEGSGENENLDEESDMREDTEEINALLYSDNYDDRDTEFDNEDDDEVSSGHSPLVKEGVCHKQEVRHELDFDDEVAISSVSSKRRKTLDGAHEKLAFIHSEEVSISIDKGSDPTIGNKRPRRDKIRETLKVLESIIPGLKSKDPKVILDEAISYLKCLKSNAETMFEEDSENSTCDEPIN